MDKDKVIIIGDLLMCLTAAFAIATSFISDDPSRDIIAAIYFVGAAIFLKMK